MDVSDAYKASCKVKLVTPRGIDTENTRGASEGRYEESRLGVVMQKSCVMG
jgi:hypothetical protein